MIPSADSAGSASPPSARRLWRQLRLVQRVLYDHLAAAVARYGAAALETIDLPSIGPAGELEPAQIRAAGALLWAREVEAAGLPAFVDALAEGVLQGTLLLPLTSGADRLMLYRRARHQRFAAEERRALYQRLFGDEFDGAWRRLVSLLDGIARAGPNDSVAAPTARALVAARSVAQWLSERSGGIATYAARSISDQVREALTLLRDPDVAQALGGGTPWRMLRLHAQEVLKRPLDPEPHLDRATSALAITGWLADVAGPLEAGSAQISAEALDAAEVWLSAAPMDGDAA